MTVSRSREMTMMQKTRVTVETSYHGRIGASEGYPYPCNVPYGFLKCMKKRSLYICLSSNTSLSHSCLHYFNILGTNVIKLFTKYSK